MTLSVVPQFNSRTSIKQNSLGTTNKRGWLGEHLEEEMVPPAERAAGLGSEKAKIRVAVTAKLAAVHMSGTLRF